MPRSNRNYDMLDQNDFFDKSFDGFAYPIAPTDDNLATVGAFCLEKWRERAAERGFSAIPDDLTDSCKFTALFGSVVFGADIAGNYDHVFNVLDDGSILDINAGASDVIGRPGIHRIDRAFSDSEDLADSIESCVQRVEAWVEEFGIRYGHRKDAAAHPKP